MQEIIKVDISKLKFDNDINSLVPEMTDEEFNHLVKKIDEEGQRTPIHINKDNTILDGRHRVRALQELGRNEISAIKEDLAKDEALKFVRDTAVNRRNLSKQQILNIVLSTDDLVGDLQARAKENQRKAAEQTNKKSRLNSKEPKRTDSTLESKELEVKPQNTNAELGKIAGVSKATVQRAKRVKKENPEAYEKVINGESTWRTEYDKILESNKPKEVPKVETQEQAEQPPVKERTVKRDRREEINARADAMTEEETNIALSEASASNIASICTNFMYTVDNIQDLELTLRFLKTQETKDLENVIKASKALIKIIEKGDLKNV